MPKDLFLEGSVSVLRENLGVWAELKEFFFHKIPTLVVEMSIKMWVPDRKLKCEMCKFKTCYTLDYAKHKDTHIIPGLACNICKCELNTPEAYGEHMEIHHPSIVFSSPEESVPSPPQESIPITQKSILTTPAPLPPASNTSNEESKYLSIAKILIFIAELLPTQFEFEMVFCYQNCSDLCEKKLF